MRFKKFPDSCGESIKLQEEGVEILVFSFSFCAICCKFHGGREAKTENTSAVHRLQSLTLGSGVVDKGWRLNCKSAEMGKCLLLNPLLVFACESLLVRFAPYLTLFSVCKRFNGHHGLPFKL